MAAVRGLRVSVKSGPGGVNEPEPMEVEEGEVEAAPDKSSPREVVSEAIEKKEQRAKRFHFRADVNDNQRDVVLDLDMMRKAIPKVRLETLYVSGVDEMSTEDIFTFFKQYPPGYIEWLDDTSCNVVWLDEVTAARALLNLSTMPTDDKSKKSVESISAKSKADRYNDSSGDETEEGEVDEDNPSDAEGEPEKKVLSTMDTLSQAEQDSLMRNDLRLSMKTFKGNQLFMRFATKEDKKELGAARRSRYYMKYGNPNYGGMKGILSNSWKKRYHSRRVQRDVTKKRTFIGDDEPAYQHLHSGLVNVPEEPIEEEEEEEDMDEDDRVVVEYRDELQAFKREREGARRSAASTSDSDEMDYDLELKMISTPSPKKSMKMTMYADELETQLKTIRNSMRSDSTSSVKNRIGSKTHSEKPADVRLLLEEKRQSSTSRQAAGAKSDVRQRLGKRPHSPEPRKVVNKAPESRREPVSDVHSRLGLPKQMEGKGLYSDSKEKKTGGLWNRLGTAPKDKPKTVEKEQKVVVAPEEDDSVLQQAWGALIKEKEQIRQKKSRLDNLPSLQIEISRESSSGSDTDS
ncbi:nuclear cap-binding protein subunit 3 isoform X3 [Hyla sarda]|uniref:nuclear cap-binding protein subunit 3 isoform X3 n=1 Tax=Hyla sarda TaxID=327740 RepID=UPI0024C37B0D|nr:nuclear cap-binding protein subunit 3 isoform X3 [Hyla sarda]